MTPSLSVVGDKAAEDRPTSVAEKVRRLQDEARGLAREHVGELQRLLVAVQRVSLDVADGGEAYPAGVRELSRRLAEETDGRLQTLEAILSRQS
ncbi:MAG: hypothetical protein ACK4YQ_07090 [Phenylobacterium sp.]|uniref:hypothetical protein n=1 Tax=Phenylobacterium sp. TaxID=1871053 RepID=UPI00391BCA38